MKSNGFLVSRLKQEPNISPTLPVIFPHLPMNANLYINSQHTQLSDRYLNNKTSQKVDTNDVKGGAISSRSLHAVKQVSSMSSTVMCSCEKSVNLNGSESKETDVFKTNLESDTPEHLGTCSAKMYDSVSPVCPTKDYSKKKGTDEPTQICYQPKSVLGKEKLGLCSKTTNNRTKNSRNAVMISDENNINSFKYGGSQVITPFFIKPDNQLTCHVTQNISKSEQTSPNNIEMGKANFLYDLRHNQNTKQRSTGCLLYPSNPWIRKPDISYKVSSKEEKPLHLFQNIDPWVKRETDCPLELSRFQTEYVCQDKPISYTKNIPFPEINKKKNCIQPTLNNIKKANDNHVVLEKPGLLFATFSYQNGSHSHKLGTNSQTKSGSFTLDRLGDISNPLSSNSSKTVNENDVNFLCRNGQEKLQIHADNLPSRHSFSSISTKCKEELPLNIRRLSEQIYKPSLTTMVPLSISDLDIRNIPASEKAFNQQSLSIGIHTTELFHGNKHISEQHASCHKDLISLKLSPKKVKPFSSTHKPDTLLETTC
ncbi:uncharacterized protein LOC117585027 isoform X1 [Drosophila guanche]|uniref:Uncharacterized protein n=1 Tax=Drosophila guanche TaxID=7266 RepID=A0A3B0KAW2_DROGU|nr:uncharacterized protein LOC117585027 isoform X1 [Drosophila guanche]SPP83239.1 Hypothetical predicted protein [Drosophila guanche]